MFKVPTNADELFAEMSKAIDADRNQAMKIGGLFQFEIGDRTWFVNMTVPIISHGANEDRRKDWVLMQMGPETLSSLLRNPSQGMQLYFDGKIKITGDPVGIGKLPLFFGMLKP